MRGRELGERFDRGKCSAGVCDPFLVQGSATEICNGLDDDCDGKIDEGLTGCVCNPQAELCDGLDQNCDNHPIRRARARTRRTAPARPTAIAVAATPASARR